MIVGALPSATRKYAEITINVGAGPVSAQKTSFKKEKFMKLVSWNVNGLRAIYKKGFKEAFKELNADIFCIQETKMQEGQIELELQGYHQYYNYAERKGYSGTAIFTKKEPINVTYGIGIEEHDKEGRVITLEFDKFYMVNCYTPNSGRELARLEYRMIWEDEFKKYLIKLDKQKPVIICGDLNVAHTEIDLKNPKSNRKNAGFTDEERSKIDNLLNSGFTDTFRKIYPDKEGAYTWWSYMFNARANNAGWRIDYFLVSDRISKSIKDAYIYSEIMGSDHCPVGLEIEE
jgi:exodeoxyribonuclease III